MFRDTLLFKFAGFKNQTFGPKVEKIHEMLLQTIKKLGYKGGIGAIKEAFQECEIM